MLSSPRRPSSTTRILSSAEKRRRVARRIFFTTSVAGSFSGTDFCLIFAPSRATMSQKSSLPQPAESVSRVLTADTRHPNDHAQGPEGRGQGHREGLVLPRHGKTGTAPAQENRRRVGAVYTRRQSWMDNLFIETNVALVQSTRTLFERLRGIAAWFAFYNNGRPHQALGQRTPMAVWRQGRTGGLANTTL